MEKAATTTTCQPRHHWQFSAQWHFTSAPVSNRKTGCSGKIFHATNVKVRRKCRLHSAEASPSHEHRAFGKSKLQESHFLSSNRWEIKLDYRIDECELRMCVTVKLAISFRHWMVHTTVSVLAFIYFLRPMLMPPPTTTATAMTAMRIQCVPVTQ